MLSLLSTINFPMQQTCSWFNITASNMKDLACRLHIHSRFRVYVHAPKYWGLGFLILFFSYVVHVVSKLQDWELNKIKLMQKKEDNN